MSVRGRTGRFVTISKVGGERVQAFIPGPLPAAAALDIQPALRQRLDAALLALGRLDSVTSLVPDTHLFLYGYIRKEAVLSSQIEGTQSSLSDLLLFEAEALPGAPLDEVIEVSGYVAALEHGLARLRGGLPLSGRLLREAHGLMLARGRGADRDPGEFRRTQNWIGGQRPGNASFVPPPATEIARLMAELERFLHDIPERTPVIVKAALAHLQFETIHPFLDGNGRVGRLLVTLLFCAEEVLRQPLLYLSLYLKTHRTAYYRHLDRVRQEGNWEEWLNFFATGVEETARGAVASAHRLGTIARDDGDRCRSMRRIGSSALRLHQALPQRPIASAGQLIAQSGLSRPTVYKVLDALAAAGMIQEITGRRRNRVYAYSAYLKVLSEGTESPFAPGR